jgi:hypothetical protein
MNLLLLVVGTIPTTMSVGAGQGEHKDTRLKFDEVSLVAAKAPNLSLLYVVLTEPRADQETLVGLVVQYARLALAEASARKFKGAVGGEEKHQYEGNVVFLVRRDRIERRGRLSGFSVEQLREIAGASGERARKLVAAHAWGLGQLPKNEMEEAKQLVIEIEGSALLPPAEQEKKIERIYRRVLPRLAEIDHFALAQRFDLKADDEGRGKLPVGEWVEKAWQKNDGTCLYLIRDAHRTGHKILAKHPEAVKPLVRADFASKEPGDVKRALREVGELRDRFYFDQVLAVLEGNNAELSEQASHTLRAINDARAIPPLVKRDARLDCYSLLRTLQSGHKARPDLVARLEAPDATVRWHAAYALAESGDPALVPHVIRLCADADPMVRENASNMGFSLKDDAYARVRPVLVKLLDDRDASVRKFAVLCFSYRQDKACAKALLDMVQDAKRTDQERIDILGCIRNLTGSYFDYDHALPPTAAKNEAAIRRFAEWVRKNAEP